MYQHANQHDSQSHPHTHTEARHNPKKGLNHPSSETLSSLCRHLYGTEQVLRGQEISAKMLWCVCEHGHSIAKWMQGFGALIRHITA